MVDGELYAASDTFGEGTDALMRLLIFGGLSGEARARCFEGSTFGARTVDLELENALLEAARRLDETHRSPTPEATGPATLPSESGPPGTDGLEALTAQEALEVAVAAVLDKNYGTARSAFRRAQTLGEDSTLVRSNLRQLDRLVATRSLSRR